MIQALDSKPIVMIMTSFEDFRGYLSVPYDQSPGLDFRRKSFQLELG